MNEFKINCVKITKGDLSTRGNIYFQIPRSSEGKEWFQYTDKDMTFELLEGTDIRMSFVHLATFFG